MIPDNDRTDDVNKVTSDTGYKRAVLGTTILSNGKGLFGPPDQNDQTSQSGPPSKLVPNIPVRPN